MNQRLAILTAFYIDAALAVLLYWLSIRFLQWFSWDYINNTRAFGGMVLTPLVILKAYLILVGVDWLGLGRRLLGVSLGGGLRKQFRAVNIRNSYIILTILPVMLFNNWLSDTAIDIAMKIEQERVDVYFSATKRFPSPSFSRFEDYSQGSSMSMFILSDNLAGIVNWARAVLILMIETLAILQTGRRFLDPWAGVTPTPRKPTPAPTLNPEPAA